MKVIGNATDQRCGGRSAMAQHLVVASPLTLEPLPVKRQPHEGIQPMRRPSEFCEQVTPAVSSMHMRQLVHQHPIQGFPRP